MQAARRPHDDEDLPPDLARLKRLCEASGVTVRLPTFDPNWELPEPIPLPDGVSLSDIIIRNRGREP
ncbi:MAG TPA: hypothetical protein VHG91_02615 [Longimicrobium sp.]|nr:hypothetical protein [Longimicrobium sp.]